MQRVEARAVMLEATHPVEIEPGVFLPPDHYKGTEWRTGLETMSGDIRWTALQYKIELTADQFASMGAPDVTKNSISEEIDVTKFVRSGELTVT
jgi:hypothetical protein